MQFKIDDRTYDVYFGIAALKYLDEQYTFKDEDTGISLGLGVEILMASLSTKNVLAVVNFMKAGTVTERQKPSDRGIESFIGSMDAEEFNRFIQEAIDELKKQPLTHLKANRMGANLQKAETQEKLEATKK